jgi:hypothetical protein
MQPINNQNKIIIWTVVGLVVILGAVGIYKWQKTKQAEQAATDQAALQAAAPKQVATKPTFGQFIRQGGTYQCNVRQNVNGMSSVGVVFIDGGMVRGDFTTSYSGTKATGSTIVRDGSAYTWSSASTDGVKIPVGSNGTLSGFVQVNGSTYSWNADQITDYDCTSWTPDASKFTIPSNIAFRDLEIKG